jgi:hypothetical protein
VSDAYAVIPDGESHPAAVFSELEAAIEWGLTRYGADSFRITGRSVRWTDAPAVTQPAGVS